jgi:hypothetical protein
MNWAVATVTAANHAWKNVAIRCTSHGMKLADFTIGAGHLCSGHAIPDMPLAFLNLTSDIPDLPEICLPPIPVIGLGDASHPLAQHLDAVLESPIGADALIAQVTAQPLGAAVLVQLLRILPGLSLEDGLTAESLAYAVLQGSEAHRHWREGREETGDMLVGEGRVLLERDGPCLTIVLDRADAGNAIDRAMRDRLYEALELAALDPEIERAVLRGNGKAFSLGAELAEFGTTTDPAKAHAIRMQTLPARQAIRCTEKLEAHVHGACVGAGLELAAFARRITASANAWFQLPELAMGILPGAGGCVSLTRQIGRQRTALMILSGKRLNARQALAWGLVDELVDDPA